MADEKKEPKAKKAKKAKTVAQTAMPLHELNALARKGVIARAKKAARK